MTPAAKLPPELLSPVEDLQTYYDQCTVNLLKNVTAGVVNLLSVAMKSVVNFAVSVIDRTT
jgi:hypothetical protein